MEVDILESDEHLFLLVFSMRSDLLLSGRLWPLLFPYRFPGKPGFLCLPLNLKADGW